MAMDDVDFEVFGNEMQYVEVELDAGEAAVNEAGMMMMPDGIEMGSRWTPSSATAASRADSSASWSAQASAC